jgi:hypothetical protein
MNTARNNPGGNGTITSSLAYGGDPAATGAIAATEEWTGAGVSVTKTISTD